MENLFRTMVKPWFMVSYFLLVVVAFLFFDQPIAHYFHDLNLRLTSIFLNVVTQLGLGELYVIGLFILALTLYCIPHFRQWSLKIWFLWGSVTFSSILCSILKMVFGRARPDLLFSANIYGFYGPKLHAPYLSFPSGHTTTIMALSFALSVLLPRFTFVFILSGLCIAFTRVVLIFHYLSDVLGACYLALLCVGGLTYWVRKKYPFILNVYAK